MIINPNNPTGAVYSRQTMLGLLDLARKHGLLVLTDEIYDQILYDDAVHCSAAALAPDLLVLTLGGLSKTYRLAGFRSGWLVIVRAARARRGLPRRPGTAGQHAPVPERAGSARDRARARRPGRHHAPARARRPPARPARLCVGADDRDSRRHLLQPAGALYLFPRLDPEVYQIPDDEQMMIDLLEQQYVLLSHGSGFNLPTTDHLRLVFLASVPGARRRHRQARQLPGRLPPVTAGLLLSAFAGYARLRAWPSWSPSRTASPSSAAAGSGISGPGCAATSSGSPRHPGPAWSQPCALPWPSTTSPACGTGIAPSRCRLSSGVCTGSSRRDRNALRLACPSPNWRGSLRRAASCCAGTLTGRQGPTVLAGAHRRRVRGAAAGPGAPGRRARRPDGQPVRYRGRIVLIYREHVDPAAVRDRLPVRPTSPASGRAGSSSCTSNSASMSARQPSAPGAQSKYPRSSSLPAASCAQFGLGHARQRVPVPTGTPGADP